MQPMYSPQGYQIHPVTFAYPGHGDQYTGQFTNKLNQNTIFAQKTIVTVNNYIPQGNVAVQMPQSMILQKTIHNNVTVHPVVIPQPYVTVATPLQPLSLNQTNVNGVQVNSGKIDPPPTNTVVNATSTEITEVSTAPSQSIHSKEAVAEPVSVKPLELNGAESKAVPQNKSWASLFNKSQNKDSDVQEVVVNGCAKAEQSPVIIEECDQEFIAMKNELKKKYDDPTFFRIGEFLTSHVLDSRTISLQPRGLINRSNYCYINSILQALLACPPMYNLLSDMSKDVTNNKEHIPMISGMSRLVKEFHHLPAGQRVGRRANKSQKKEQNCISINCDVPFEPKWIHKMLNGKRSDSFVVEGRQEDAEEFLGCLLNGLNDEMLDVSESILLLMFVSNLKKIVVD